MRTVSAEREQPQYPTHCLLFEPANQLFENSLSNSMNRINKNSDLAKVGLGPKIS